jgi:PadR family transcriptional regulator, regulatory protein PadR
MQIELNNWRVQVKKGYLEMCLLLVLRKHKRMYGLELLEKLESLQLALKEGTLYPMLNRMTEDGLLVANWETTNVKGHPRKFYALTKRGLQSLREMEDEFLKMTGLVSKLQR